MSWDVGRDPVVPDVLRIRPQVHEDARGWLIERWTRPQSTRAGIPELVQWNESCSLVPGTLRGLHLQLPPHAQGKLVACLAGRAWDVAVDLRKGSATLGRWTGIGLSADEPMMVWIPPGFAHGFLTLEQGTRILYGLSSLYEPTAQQVLRWDDPDLAIPWPAPVTAISARDEAGLHLEDMLRIMPEESA